MEELQHAIKREAKIYGEILGYSSLNEALILLRWTLKMETMALNIRRR